MYTTTIESPYGEIALPTCNSPLFFFPSGVTAVPSQESNSPFSHWKNICGVDQFPYNSGNLYQLKPHQIPNGVAKFVWSSTNPYGWEFYCGLVLRPQKRLGFRGTIIMDSGAFILNGDTTEFEEWASQLITDEKIRLTDTEIGKKVEIFYGLAQWPIQFKVPLKMAI